MNNLLECIKLSKHTSVCESLDTSFVEDGQDTKFLDKDSLFTPNDLYLLLNDIVIDGQDMGWNSEEERDVIETARDEYVDYFDKIKDKSFDSYDDFYSDLVKIYHKKLGEVEEACSNSSNEEVAPFISYKVKLRDKESGLISDKDIMIPEDRDPKEFTLANYRDTNKEVIELKAGESKIDLSESTEEDDPLKFSKDEIEKIKNLFERNQKGIIINSRITKGFDEDNGEYYDVFEVECDNSNSLYLSWILDDLKTLQKDGIDFYDESNDNGFYGRTFRFYKMI